MRPASPHNLDTLKAAPSPLAQDRFSELTAATSQMPLDELRSLWHRQFGRQAPRNLCRSLLRRLLLYRVQAEELGDVTPVIARHLEQISNEGDRTLIARNPDQGILRPGTILVREHEGTRHQVTVTNGGFSWNGEEFRSLSAVAQAITGTKWNGHRFFGLRGAADAKA